MKLSDIVARLSDKLRLSHNDIHDAVRIILNSIIDKVAARGRVEVRCFGSFNYKDPLPPRTIISRITGQEIIHGGRPRVKFKAGRSLKGMDHGMGTQAVNEDRL